MSGNDGAANQNQDENQFRAQNPGVDPDNLDGDVPPAGHKDGPPPLSEMNGPYGPAIPELPYAPPPGMSTAKEGDDVAVDLDDLRAYHGRVNDFQRYVRNAYTLLNGADPIKPGTFPAGARVENAVNGEGGLTPGTTSFLLGVANSFTSIGTHLTNVITLYEEAEDANKVTAQQIGNEFSEGFGMIEGLGDKGPTATS